MENKLVNLVGSLSIRRAEGSCTKKRNLEHLVKL